MRFSPWKIGKSASPASAGDAEKPGPERESTDDVNMDDVDDDDELPTYAAVAEAGPVSLQLHSVPDRKFLLAKFQPPQSPIDIKGHVPCDIVLVIDVSGSMNALAPAPGEDTSEAAGLSVLDLVKHAAMTIIETLTDNDRLGIVTFGSQSKILQSLIPMSDVNKEESRKKVKSMKPIDATNLWHGILDGLKVFEQASSSQNVASMMVLTDGCPNHMCPQNGYVPKIKKMMPLPATINTFGFGYSLRSGLLKAIAEVGNGNYAFIPDAGMIGTVFVHAVANLQSTFATQATLTLRYQDPLQVTPAMGQNVLQEPVRKTRSGKVITVHLGTIHYGQSRDFVFGMDGLPRRNADEEKGPVIEATLTMKPALGGSESKTRSRTPRFVVSESSDVCQASVLPAEELAYHESRAELCQYLSSLFRLGTTSEYHAKTNEVQGANTDLAALVNRIPARNFDDAKNDSLMEDLIGEEPNGQITLSISKDTHFLRWGAHYLPSYLNAHTSQICNSFKDSGPLQYGRDNPLFIECRDKLDTAFDTLPAPEPTWQFGHGALTPGSSVSGSYKGGVISMSRWNNSCGPCFAGSTPVLLVSGRSVPIKKLRRGMRVTTPMGGRRVALVLKTPVREQSLCKVGGLMVTPWHPISGDGKEWCFPAAVADAAVRYTGAIYSVMLESGAAPEAHALSVGGLWGVTLGHGIVDGEDVRAHEFLGDHARVRKMLCQLGVGKGGIVLGAGVKRDAQSGRVCGFASA